MFITLTDTIPSKKNSKIIRCMGTRPVLLPSTKHKAWIKDKLMELRTQVQVQEPITTTSSMTITFYSPITKKGEPSKRKFDLTNKAESVMDFLVDYGLLEDDNFAVCPELTLKYGGGRTESGCDISITI